MILLLLLLLFSSFYIFQENYIPAIILRQDLKKLASSSPYFPTMFQHQIHPPENGIWLYKLCDQEK